MTRDELWPHFEKRFSKLDEIRDDMSKPLYERAEAEARRAELARAWSLVTGEAVSGS